MKRICLEEIFRTKSESQALLVEADGHAVYIIERSQMREREIMIRKEELERIYVALGHARYVE